MSTLRISNIEAKSVPASATVDEKVKITNSSGDVLVFLDGKTSGITTVGINTTDGNITFDANSNVVVTGIITATKFVGTIEGAVSGDLSIADKIIHTGDTNTAIRFPEADNFTVECAGNERFRVKPTNDIAVFTGSNSGTLTIRNDTSNEVQIHSGGSDALILGSGGENERLRITSDGKIGFNYAATPPSEDIMICTAGQASPASVSLSHLSGGNRYGLRFQTVSGTNAGISLSPFINSSYQDFIRITYDNTTNDGKLGINNLTPSYALDIQHTGANQANAAVSRFRQITDNGGEDHALMLCRHAGARPGSNGVDLLFQNSGGTTVGKIDHGHSTTQYRTSSDYRLKENDVKITDGITRIKKLRPIRFNFIAEPDKTVDGFFAHEAADVVPEAVSGTKDEVDSDNNPIIQGIDHSKLVPLLTAALQEEIAKRESLEARIVALEGS